MARSLKLKALLIRLSRGHVQNVRFGEFVDLIEVLGFQLGRIEGSHHLFVHRALGEVVNLQPQGGDAKPYQIRQFLRLVQRYNLRLEENR